MALKRRSSFYKSGADSRSVQRYKQLEARFTEQLLKSPATKVVTKLTPSRRIKPTFLFAKCISPSPSHKRTLTFGDVEQQQTKRTGETDFASPQKGFHSASQVITKKFTALANSRLDSPSKNTRSQVDLSRSADFNLVNQIKRQVLLSPPGQKGTRSLIPDSPSQNTRSSLMKDHKKVSPTRSTCKSKLNFDSPSKPTNSVPSGNLLLSPAGNTRSHNKSPPKTPKSGSAPDTTAKTPTLNSGSIPDTTPKKYMMLSEQFKTPERGGFTSPGRGERSPVFPNSAINRVKSKLFSPAKMSPLVKGEDIRPKSLRKSPAKIQPELLNNDTMLSPRRSVRLFNKFSPENNTKSPPLSETNTSTLQLATPKKNDNQRVFKVTPPSVKRSSRKSSVDRTPPSNYKNKSPATSPFDKWPKRKPRSEILRSPAQKKLIQEETTLESETETQIIKRKVSSKKKKNWSLDRETSLVSSPRVKRKLSPESAFGSASSGVGTPSKRRRGDSVFNVFESSESNDTLARFLSQSTETSLSQTSQSEYFQNDEIFLTKEDTQPFGFEFQNRNLGTKTTSNLSSWSDSVPSPAFLSLQVKRNANIESDGESSSSAVFTSPFHSKHSNMKVDGELQTSPPVKRNTLSPSSVKFSPHVSSKSLLNLMNSPMLSDDSEASGYSKRKREYSPNITKQKMMHLIQSPLLCEGQDKGQGQTRSGGKGHGVRGEGQPKKSRRALYRTQTSTE